MRWFAWSLVKLAMTGCLASALLLGVPFVAMASGSGGGDTASVAPPEAIAAVEEAAGVKPTDEPSQDTAMLEGVVQEAPVEDGATLEGVAPSAGYKAEAPKELGLGPWFALFSPSAIERAQEAALSVAKVDISLAAMLAAAVAVLAASSATALVVATETTANPRPTKNFEKKTMVTKRRKLDAGI